MVWKSKKHYTEAGKGKSRKSDSDLSQALGKGFSDSAVQNFRKKLHGILRNEKDLRDRAILEFFLATGLRAAAVVEARFSDLLKTPQGDTVLKYLAKGGKIKFIALSPDVIQYVKDYHRLCAIKHDYFFLTIPTNANPERHPMTTRALQSIVEVWGLKTLHGKSGHPHAFRHTVGQALTDEQGVGTAQIALGHENIQTTERFYLNKFVNPGKILKDKWKK